MKARSIIHTVGGRTYISASTTDPDEIAAIKASREDFEKLMKEVNGDSHGQLNLNGENGSYIIIPLRLVEAVVVEITW